MEPANFSIAPNDPPVANLIIDLKTVIRPLKNPFLPPKTFLNKPLIVLNILLFLSLLKILVKKFLKPILISLNNFPERPLVKKLSSLPS